MPHPSSTSTDSRSSAATKQQGVARGLATVATVLDRVGALPALPFVTAYTTGHVDATWQLMNDSSDLDKQKEMARSIIRAVNAFSPGSWDKAESLVSTWFQYTRRIDGVKFEILVNRAAVCERVVTGTRTVVERVPDPEHVVPTVEVERVVEDFEWRCQPLLDGDVEQAEAVPA